MPTTELNDYLRAPMQAHKGGYYIRLEVLDVPGALAAITSRLGENGISLESVIQRPDIDIDTTGATGADIVEKTRTLVLITQDILESSLRKALDQVADDGHTKGAPQVIRIESF